MIFNGTGCTRNIIMVAVIADWFPITTKDSESTTTKISKHIATKYSKYASEKHSKSTSTKDSKSTITENSTSLTSDVSKSPRTENRNQWNQENSRVYIRHTKASETSWYVYLLHDTYMLIRIPFTWYLAPLPFPVYLLHDILLLYLFQYTFYRISLLLYLSRGINERFEGSRIQIGVCNYYTICNSQSITYIGEIDYVGRPNASLFQG